MFGAFVALFADNVSDVENRKLFGAFAAASAAAKNHLDDDDIDDGDVDGATRLYMMTSSSAVMSGDRGGANMVDDIGTRSDLNLYESGM